MAAGDLEEHPAHWGGCVDPLVDHDQGHAPGLQVEGQGDQVREGQSEQVELGDDQPVAFPCDQEGLVQIGAASQLPTGLVD